MNILYCADTRFPIERANGVQTMATCHALASRGHKVTLLARADTATPPRDPFAFYGWPRLPHLRIEVIAGARHHRARRAQFLIAALRRVISTQADVILTRDLGLAAFVLQLPSPRRSPLVYESHGVSVIVSAEMPTLLGKPELEPSHQKLQRLERRERRVWRRAEAYVTITRALCVELTSRYGPRERIFVVPDGVRLPADAESADTGSPDAGRADPAGLDAAADAESAAPPPAAPPVAVAGYAGHLYPWKGVDVFVNALALTSGIRGLIVGGHPGEADRVRLETLVRDLGLSERVEITGLVAPSEVQPRLRAATMLVLPNTRSAVSERYTSPLKLFEYLSLGLPIIASDLPAIREVLTDTETAVLVPAGDAQAMAAAMAKVASDPVGAARIGAASLALAPEYTWDRRAEKLEAALEAAIAK